MNLLNRLNPEALAKLEDFTKEYPSSMSRLKNQLTEVNDVFDLKFETVLTLAYSLNIELRYTTIKELFI